MCFDQMAALYNHYHVIASKIEVVFTQRDQNRPACRVGIIPDDDSSVPTMTEELLEQNLTKVTALGFLGVTPKKLTAKFSAKNIYGGSILANNALRGTNATDPTEQYYFNVFANSIMGEAAEVNCTATITYIAVWSEARNIPSS